MSVLVSEYLSHYHLQDSKQLKIATQTYLQTLSYFDDPLHLTFPHHPWASLNYRIRTRHKE